MTVHTVCDPNCEPAVEQLPSPWPPNIVPGSTALPTALAAPPPGGGNVTPGMTRYCYNCEAPLVAQLPDPWPPAAGSIDGGGGGGGIPEAPTDGVQYGRQSASWTPIAAGGGGVDQAYVDSENQAQTQALTALIVQKVAKAGDTMTGPLSVNGNFNAFALARAHLPPVDPTDIANKAYVDTAVAALTAGAFTAQIDRLSALVEYLQTRLASLEATMEARR